MLGGGRSVGGVGNWGARFVLTADDGDISWKCGHDARKHYERTIAKHPKFPFPYYMLAVCLLDEDEERWRTVAEAGLHVAERTTGVARHDPAHDEVLNKFRILLRDEQGSNAFYRGRGGS